MTPNEIAAAEERLADWNARDKQLQADLRKNAEDRLTIESNRRNNKAQYAELYARVQAAKKSLGIVREPHPDKQGVVIERVPVEVQVEVEKPVTVGRALKKLFTGR